MTAVLQGRPTGAPRGALVALVASALTLAATGCGAPAGAHPAGYAKGDDAAHHSRSYCGRIPHPVLTQERDWRRVARAIGPGHPGTLTNHRVWRFPLPRRDLKVVSHGVHIAWSLALSGDAAFARYCDGSTMLMGDMVLTDRELPRVTDALQRVGIHQTALHKHLPEQKPSIWWTHFEAMGNPVILTRKLRYVLSFTATPRIASLEPPRKIRPRLDTDAIDAALGRPGMAEGKTYKFFLPRQEKIISHGHIIPPEMGVSTVIKFQDLGHGRAAINGDLLVTADEVQRAIRALRRGHITLVELHNHMLDEHPRIFFLHYWAVGDAVELARGLRPALDQTRLVPANDEEGGPDKGGEGDRGGRDGNRTEKGKAEGHGHRTGHGGTRHHHRAHVIGS